MRREEKSSPSEKFCRRDELCNAAHSENTRIAYDKGWECFVSWCAESALEPLDAKPDDIVSFLIAMSDDSCSTRARPLAINTLRLYRSALNDRWAKMGLISPASTKIVDDVLRGLVRLRREDPRRVKALQANQIQAMLDTCGESLHELRDAAMLSLGFAGALRRSEIVHLMLMDFEDKESDGTILNIRRSKTDSSGVGQRIAIIEGRWIKPISRVYRWLEKSGIRDGFVFQTLRRGGIPSGFPLDPGDVARIVKRRVQMIGLNPSEYSGHSLRAGFVTSAAIHRARIDKIMEVTRHRSAETVLKYIRDEESFVDHAGTSFL